MDKTIKISVYRHTPGEGPERYEQYTIPRTAESMTIFNALSYIRENYDSSLSFYVSCRFGRCLGCFVDVDGKTELACTTVVHDGMKIGPHNKWPLIKDLAVDFKP